MAGLNPGSVSCPSWVTDYGLQGGGFLPEELGKWSWALSCNLSRGHPAPPPPDFPSHSGSLRTACILAECNERKLAPEVSPGVCPELVRSFWQDFRATSKLLTEFGRSQTIRRLRSILSPWGWQGRAPARFLVECCFGWNQGAFLSASPGLKEARRNTMTSYFG